MFVLLKVSLHFNTQDNLYVFCELTIFVKSKLVEYSAVLLKLFLGHRCQ